MAADVSTENNKEEGEGRNGELVTRDLLGGGGSGGAGGSGGQLETTVEWERKFDLLMGQRGSGSGRTSRPINLNLPPPPVPSFSSVCTLEKVKSALERANAKSNGSAPFSFSASASIKRPAAAEKGKMDGQDDAKPVGGPMMVSRCPKCMQYLLVFKVDPRCPRCDAHVPEPNYLRNNDSKKPRIDLNESFTAD